MNHWAVVKVRQWVDGCLACCGGEGLSFQTDRVKKKKTDCGGKPEIKVLTGLALLF